MHYVSWVGFIPRNAPDAIVAFNRRVPLLRGRRVRIAGLVGRLFLATLFISDYAQGRAMYSAVASCHADLEFLVLLALLLAPASLAGSVRAGPRS